MNGNVRCYIFVENKKNMKKLAKVLYGMNGVTCIFIGVLHTIAHYSELLTEDIKTRLDHKIVVTGLESNIWDLWQGMSLMMGYFIIVIGVLHLFIISQIQKNNYPPIGASIIMILMLLGVIYAGLNFFSIWQVYGGIMGIALQTTCLVISIKKL